jgi:hypothetical protein
MVTTLGRAAWTSVEMLGILRSQRGPVVLLGSRCSRAFRTPLLYRSRVVADRVTKFQKRCAGACHPRLAQRARTQFQKFRELQIVPKGSIRIYGGHR